MSNFHYVLDGDEPGSYQLLFNAAQSTYVVGRMKNIKIIEMLMSELKKRPQVWDRDNYDLISKYQQSERDIKQSSQLQQWAEKNKLTATLTDDKRTLLLRGGARPVNFSLLTGTASALAIPFKYRKQTKDQGFRAALSLAINGKPERVPTDFPSISNYETIEIVRNQPKSSSTLVQGKILPEINNSAFTFDRDDVSGRYFITFHDHKQNGETSSECLTHQIEKKTYERLHLMLADAIAHGKPLAHQKQRVSEAIQAELDAKLTVKDVLYAFESIGLNVKHNTMSSNGHITVDGARVIQYYPTTAYFVAEPYDGDRSYIKGHSLGQAMYIAQHGRYQDRVVDLNAQIKDEEQTQTNQNRPQVQANIDMRNNRSSLSIR